MKEKFETRRLFGTLNVACRFDDGTTRYWKAEKSEVVKQIVSVVTEYDKLGYRLTLRQLHYQFVSRNWIVNHDTAYKKLGKILDDCRYGGIVDWDSIEDRGRIPKLPYYVLGIKDALKDTINHYRLDRQEGQDTHIEVWTEKDALSGIMYRSTSKYHVKLVVNKGYTSSSAIYEAYERLCTRLDNGQQVIILYFGDHDPSGLDMIRDVRERLEFMFSNGDKKPDWEGSFDVIPIGLTKKQIKQYRCPPNPTKMTDSRSPNYIAEHGKTCWEVDALPPEALTQILEANIEEHLDAEQFNEMLENEKKDIATLTKFIKKAK